jgi:hypothetical protein
MYILLSKRVVQIVSVCLVHAAIIAINEAIETQVTADIMTALGNPSANLVGIDGVLAENYSADLYNAKQTKTENAKNKVLK